MDYWKKYLSERGYPEAGTKAGCESEPDSFANQARLFALRQIAEGRTADYYTGILEGLEYSMGMVEAYTGTLPGAQITWTSSALAFRCLQLLGVWTDA